MGYFTNYPKHVFLILSNEFCERFSYYGMKAILVIYLNLALGFSEGTSVSIYHTFNVLCYFTPLLGAMIADGWLGKYKTILYVSIIYVFGNIVMTVTAIPINGEFIVWSPFIGLVIIAFGTGGIKPCVSAFGGDQFSDTQQRQKDSFFSLFYMAINIGSLLSTIITPLIRSNIECFGQECYAVAFGIPAVLMIVAILLFVAGTRWYTRIPPGESILVRMFGCIGTALKGKCTCNKQLEDKRDHWLDYAEPKYDKRFIADVKDVLSVCWLFIPLPMFWALFDQQGSRWTLQAKKLDGDFGGFVMQPDMMQVLNALLVVIFVPLLESLIYPCLDKLRIPNRPLQRMGWGMIFAATAFLMSGFLQIAIDNESPAAVAKGQIKYSFVNLGQCPITVHAYDPYYEQLELAKNQNSEYFYVPWNPNGELVFTENCVRPVPPKNFSLSLSTTRETLAYQILLNDSAVDPYDPYIHVQEKVDFTLDLLSTIRVYNTLDQDVDVVFHVGSTVQTLFNISSQNFSNYQALKLGDFTYEVRASSGTPGLCTPGKGGVSQNGAVYTLLLEKDSADVCEMVQLTDLGPRSINIFIQVPQYVVMTLGEVLFSVTGLGFAYSQASKSMKSILTACWLLTVAIGNVVVVIIAESGSSMKQTVEFFLFSGLMYVTTVIFVIMCLFYKYVEPRDDTSSRDDASVVTDDVMTGGEGGKSNTAFSMGGEKDLREAEEQTEEQDKQRDKEPDNEKEREANVIIVRSKEEEEEEDNDENHTSF